MNPQELQFCFCNAVKITCQITIQFFLTVDGKNGSYTVIRILYRSRDIHEGKLSVGIQSDFIVIEFSGITDDLMIQLMHTDIT